MQVEKHDSRESVWFVHDNKVYDGTKFLKEHPGGAESILMVGGQDATEEFNAIHSSKAKSMLADFMIGQIGNKAEAAEDVPPERAPIDKQVSQLMPRLLPHDTRRIMLKREQLGSVARIVLPSATLHVADQVFLCIEVVLLSKRVLVKEVIIQIITFFICSAMSEVLATTVPLCLHPNPAPVSKQRLASFNWAIVWGKSPKSCAFCAGDE